MIIEILELLAKHGGTVALFLGIPYVTLTVAVVVLWKHGVKKDERIMKLVESKVEQDAKLEAAFNSLKEVIKARGG